MAVGGDMERSQCLLGGLMQSDCERLGNRALVELLVRASESLQVLVGRTFGDGLIGALKTIELTGDIECLDWFQLLGPAVVARWGREALVNGPFYEVRDCEAGAMCILMGPGPFEP